MITELSIILLLVALNGFFSGSEIAIIAVKKSRLHALVDEGDQRARLVLALKESPDNFFATVQIGVTLVSTLASAYGGQRIVEDLSPLLKSLAPPNLSSYVDEIALLMFVLMISYLSLVFGELIPKSLALHSAERFALSVAAPLHAISRVFRPFTVFLTFSSNIVLKLFKDKTSFSETRLVEEEIRQLLEEGVQAGTIASHEHEIIHNVFEFNDTAAREIMIPRVDIQALDVETEADDVRKVVDVPFSRLPVFQDSLDHIVGILHVKDLLRALARGQSAGLTELVRPAFFVPESMKIDKIMQEMQKRRLHMAIVVDEYGGTSGLLTMEDILEEIVGEIQDVTEGPEADDITRVSETVFLVAGSCSIAEFNEYFVEHPLPEADSYNSLAGFVIERVGRFPEIGEKLKIGNLTVQLQKRVRQKLVQFRVELIPASVPVAEEES